MSDEEAFDKWFKKRYRYSYKDLVIPESVNPQKEAWQAALEHERERSKMLVEFIKTLDNSSYDNYSEEALEVLAKYNNQLKDTK